jgi:DNA-binding NtrC family response regulator
LNDKAAARRVLVVDDEPLIRWSLRQMLEDQGYTVKEAASAAETLAVLAAPDTAFDTVLLDLRLPDSSDLALLTTLRHRMPKATIILMTAFSTPEVTQQALALGVVTVVSKPFELNEITNLVRQSH